MSEIRRKSARGRLAQAMFDEWMRVHGQEPRKFPKTVGGRRIASIWWIMAGVALDPTAASDARCRALVPGRPFCGGSMTRQGCELREFHR